jgi:hypothetical protein
MIDSVKLITGCGCERVMKWGNKFPGLFVHVPIQNPIGLIPYIREAPIAKFESRTFEYLRTDDNYWVYLEK